MTDSEGDGSDSVFQPLEELAAGTDGIPLPAPVKRNFWKSLGRLIGGSVDIGVAYLEYHEARKQAQTDEIRATAKARRHVKLASADHVVANIAGNENLLAQTTEFLGNEMLVEQCNRGKIAEYALDEIRDTQAQGENQNENNNEIDEDWLNSFSKEASNKSSEEMQLLFGKILAGEIRKPGSFSIKSVRTLASLPRRAARYFEILCARSVAVPFVVWSKVVVFEGQAAQNALAPFGLNFDVLNNLAENDLIYPDFGIYHDVSVIVEHRVPFEYANETVWLQPANNFNRDALKRVTGPTLSEVGRELRQIVGVEPDAQYTHGFVNWAKGRKVELYKVVERQPDGKLKGRPYRDLL